MPLMPRFAAHYFGIDCYALKFLHFLNLTVLAQMEKS
jgi:hypothetical protein